MATEKKELSKQTKKEIAQSIREIKAGKYRTQAQVEAELGFRRKGR